MPSGIWLDDATYLQTQGQMWAQQQTQNVHAGVNWAQQAMQDTVGRLQQMVPQIPTTPAPAPAAPAPVAPPPVEAPPPAPMPAPPPVPIGGPTPAAGALPAPSDLTGAGITPPPPAPTPPPAPMPAPAPAPSTPDVGQTWAQQQIQNLLNPSAPPSSSTPTPGAQPIPGLGTGLPPSTPSPAASPASTTGATPSADVRAPSQLPPIDSSSPSAFAKSFAPYAQYAAQKLGVDPTWVTAMAASESNYGKAAGNELFGIKALPGQPGTSMQTHEGEYGGTQQNATFASYNSPLDAVDAYVDLLKNHYQGALGAQDLGTFVHGLKQGGYFTAAEDEYKGILSGISNRIGGDVQAGLQQVGTGIDTAKQAVGNAAQTGLSAVNTAVQGVQSAVARTSQFALGLSSGDAMAFCGPTAAIAFAQSFGRNPTVAEAKQLAQQVGWNPDQGMAGPQSEVQLLKTMGVDAHMTQGVDWATVGRDASGGNPVILDTPGHYYYVDGYNQQTGQLHVGTSGTDLKGGSEWMTPDQINAMPQSHGAARAAIFADHPLAQSDGLAQSTSRLTMGTMQPGSSAQPDLGSSIGQAVGNAPLPFLGGQSLSDISGLLGQNSQQLQQGRDLVGGILSPDSSTTGVIQAKANSILQAVQDVGSQASKAGQDLLTQGQNVLGNAQSNIAQAPTTIQGILQQNALTSQGIPNIGGQALEGAGNLMSGIGGAVNAAATDPNAGPIGLTRNLLQAGAQGLASNVESDPTLFGAGVRGAISAYQSPLRQQMFPNITDPEHPVNVMNDLQARYGTSMPDDRMTPEDKERAQNLMMAIGGTVTPADWIQGAYKGGVIGGLNTMADVASNATLSPILSAGAGYVRDLASLAPGRMAGRTLGAMSGITDWGNNFLSGLSDSLSRPTSLSARAGGGAPRIMANLIEGAGALHGAFQNATSELIQAMEQGAAAGDAAGNTIFSPGWKGNFTTELGRLPADVVARAQAVGDRTAGRGDLGTLASAFGNFVNRAGPIGDALFPVYRMGMALGSRMVEASPLGLVGTGFDVARGLAGKGPYAAGLGSTPTGTAVGPLTERLTNNIIGTVASMWLANKALSGQVTGDGPTDPGQHQAWLANGNQPNSFIGPDGAYHSWQKLPPQLRGPLMTAGAYADAYQAYTKALATKQTAGPQAYGIEEPLTAAAWQLVSEIGRQVASATPMRTLADLYDAVGSSSNASGAGMSAAGDVASKVLGGLVPASGTVRSLAEMTDPTQRQTLTPRTLQELPQSVLEHVAQNIPGLREGLPARQDVLGRPISNPLQGLGELLPVRTAAGQQTPLLEAMQRLGVAPSGPPATIPYGPAAELRLRPEEQRAFEQYRGQILQQSAAPLVGTAKFQALAPYAQRAALEQINTVAADAAGKMVLRDLARTPGAAQSRQQSTGVLAPVVGYGPDILGNQYTDPGASARLAQHQALIQSLLGS